MVKLGYEIFLETLKNNGQTTEGYENILEKLKNNAFVKRILVYRNKKELKEFIKGYKQILKELKKKKLYIYKNPEACRIFNCPYYSLCIEDTEENRKFNFHKREVINPELNKN